MNHIEIIERICQCIRLDKRKGITWLRLNINTHHVKPCLHVSPGAAASPAKQIEQARFRLHTPTLRKHVCRRSRARKRRILTAC